MFHTQATGGCVESHSLADQSHAQSRRTQETQEVLFSSHHARRASQWVRVCLPAARGRVLLIFISTCIKT